MAKWIGSTGGRKWLAERWRLARGLDPVNGSRKGNSRRCDSADPNESDGSHAWLGSEGSLQWGRLGRNAKARRHERSASVRNRLECLQNATIDNWRGFVDEADAWRNDAIEDDAQWKVGMINGWWRRQAACERWRRFGWKCSGDGGSKSLLAARVSFNEGKEMMN